VTGSGRRDFIISGETLLEVFRLSSWSNDLDCTFECGDKLSRAVFSKLSVGVVVPTEKVLLSLDWLLETRESLSVTAAMVGGPYLATSVSLEDDEPTLNIVAALSSANDVASATVCVVVLDLKGPETTAVDEGGM
jgi:hypothetical protein